MKMRAAVLEQFGEPLSVQEVELAEPRAGEVLVRLAACGVATPTSTPPPAPTLRATRRPCSGTRAPGVVERSGPTSTLARAGRPRRHPLLAPVRRMRSLPRPAHQPLPGDPRAAEPGLSARRHDALSRDGDPIRHFMGCSTFAEYDGDAGDRPRQGQPRGALRARLPLRLRPLDRPRRGDQHRRGASRAAPAWSSAPAWSAWERSPAAACRAPSGSSASTFRQERLELARGQGATDLLLGGESTVEEILEMTGGFGADYTFEATGQRRRDAPGGRSGAHGLGPMHGRRRRRQGGDPRRGPPLPDHRAPRSPVPRSAASRAATRSRCWSTATSPARSISTPSSPTASASTRSTAGFELMEAQDGIRSVIEFA